MRNASRINIAGLNLKYDSRFHALAKVLMHGNIKRLRRCISIGEMEIDMNIDDFVNGLDELFEKNDKKEIENYLVANLSDAIAMADTSAIIVILNEMISFFRSTNQYDKSLLFADKAVNVVKSAGLFGTTYYATTLINQANALRAAGRSELALDKFLEANEIYEKELEKGDFGFAELYNNLSLAYMELENFKEAVLYLRKALEIVLKHKEEKGFELAVTYTNLGNALYKLSENDTGHDGKKTDGTGLNYSEEQRQIRDETIDYLTKAMDYFKGRNLFDTHYAAAVTGLGDIYEKEEAYDKAYEMYTEAMDAIRTNMGFIDFYYRVKDRLDRCIAKAKETGLILKHKKGLELARELYEDKVKISFDKEFHDVYLRSAIGLAGYGSDCYGLDDDISTDHDWGPALCIWLNDEDYENYADSIQKMYDSCVEEFISENNLKPRRETPQGNGRVGVLRLCCFVNEILGCNCFDNEVEWSYKTNSFDDILKESIEEVKLSTITNGEIFHAGDGKFVNLRKTIGEGYTGEEKIMRLKRECVLFSQNLQYNLRRTLVREDFMTARLIFDAGVRNALDIMYLINDKYRPHDKLLFKMLISMGENEFAEKISELINEYEGFLSRVKASDKNKCINITDEALRTLTTKIDELAIYIIGRMKTAKIMPDDTGRDAYLAELADCIIKS